jgi:hypothetical protein
VCVASMSAKEVKPAFIGSEGHLAVLLRRGSAVMYVLCLEACRAFLPASAF